ncbi:peptide chain release factor 1 [Ureaplasma zalophigenitalium]|uniref:Peptide chain release factor 1 n=1 Tax=Ureaplasma zalophigenitalium TaxID=907723 RepID=A0ABT3BQ19_9BACT|nr:peptide chain release factor 1 [Ureaplasma zalophigenitalium]MCV3754321.1 peptide chain release factor 1 [Ureaplasma zalophigenitalium]
MEYNKKLFDAIKKVVIKNNELKKELETISNDFKRMKEINIQLKKTNQVADVFADYEQAINNGVYAEEILKTEKDVDMLELAQTTLHEAKEQIPVIEEKIKILLLPSDPNDDKNVIVEMRPAAGGDESSIFVGNLFDTYRAYVESRNWKMKIIEMIPSSVGFNFISFMISGEEVYSRMKFESGVHRVQRVPATESKGRVHTSTITVAVLPEQDEVDITINPSDLRIDTYRASGAGGQHVNRTESAVRITHIPTGVVAACQEGKSQIENRETAMKMLRSKLWEEEQRRQNEEFSNLRKNQVGTGDRSEKIRTYNYPQNRITDHRINLTLNKLDYIMLGTLDDIIDPLIADEQTTLMTNLEI